MIDTLPTIELILYHNIIYVFQSSSTNKNEPLMHVSNCTIYSVVQQHIKVLQLSADTILRYGVTDS